MHVHNHVRMYACMHVCNAMYVYVCMYVCMYDTTDQCSCISDDTWSMCLAKHLDNNLHLYLHEMAIPAATYLRRSLKRRNPFLHHFLHNSNTTSTHHTTRLLCICISSYSQFYCQLLTFLTIVHTNQMARSTMNEVGRISYNALTPQSHVIFGLHFVITG